MRKKTEIRIIKKYQNRRLYDTATSMYIVLDDIKQYITEGETIKVVDVKTEQDVTRSVLLQIILEEEVNGIPMFSDDFLFQIIRFYGKALQPSISPFLENGITLFREMQKQFYSQLGNSLSAGNDVKVKMDKWNDFINQGNSKMENAFKDYIENSKEALVKMQDNFKNQAQSMLNYMQFPFANKSSKK